MTLFKNTVILRGFLGRDAEAPASHGIGYQSFAVLTVCIDSGAWKKATNEWVPQTARHTVICPGPFFCGFTRGMKQGEYVEIVGELRRTLIEEGNTLKNSLHAYLVHATQIRRLEIPPVGVDEDEDG